MTDPTCADFVEVSTIHGLVQIVRSRSTTERLLLTASFLVCIILLLYSIGQVVSQYRSQPMGSTSLIQEAKNLKLPDLTICPFNRLDKQFFDRHNISYNLAKYIEWAFFITNPIYDFVSLPVARSFYTKEAEAVFNATLLRLNMSFETLLQEASIPCSAFAKYCTHNYGLFNCCRQVIPVPTNMGQCFRFRGRFQRTQGCCGTGLSFQMRLPLDRYLPSENNMLNDGILIKLTEPNRDHEYDVIFIPPGTHALIQLRATKYDLLDDPPRYSCHRVAPSDQYASTSCAERCLLEIAEKTCSCRYAGGSGTVEATLPICTTQQVITCLYRSLVPANDEEGRLERCRRQCKPLCQHWRYDATVSYAKYPSHTLTSGHLKGNSTYKRDIIRAMQSMYIILDLQYERLEYTHVRNYYVTSPFQLLASIGGLMVFWIGGSMISFIHLAIFLCLFSKNKFQNKEGRPAVSGRNEGRNTADRDNTRNQMLCDSSSCS